MEIVNIVYSVWLLSGQDVDPNFKIIVLLSIFVNIIFLSCIYVFVYKSQINGSNGEATNTDDLDRDAVAHNRARNFVRPHNQRNLGRREADILRHAREHIRGAVVNGRINRVAAPLVAPPVNLEAPLGMQDEEVAAQAPVGDVIPAAPQQVRGHIPVEPPAQPGILVPAQPPAHEAEQEVRQIVYNIQRRRVYRTKTNPPSTEDGWFWPLFYSSLPVAAAFYLESKMRVTIRDNFKIGLFFTCLIIYILIRRYNRYARFKHTPKNDMLRDGYANDHNPKYETKDVGPHTELLMGSYNHSEEKLILINGLTMLQHKMAGQRPNPYTISNAEYHLYNEYRDAEFADKDELLFDTACYFYQQAYRKEMLTKRINQHQSSIPVV